MTKHDMQFNSLFEGDREDCRSWLSKREAAHFVYLLERPDGTPFFVGTGSGPKGMEGGKRPAPVAPGNPLRINIIRQIEAQGGDVGYRIESTWPDAEACAAREAALIDEIGCWHQGGPLANIAPSDPAAQGHPHKVALDRFLVAIGPLGTIPVKPMSLMRALRPTPFTPEHRAATVGCALALVASACAHGIALQPGVAIPRGFLFNGVAAIIDNGGARDIIAAGMADLIPASEPAAECYKLSAMHIQILRALLGDEMLELRGLL